MGDKVVDSAALVTLTVSPQYGYVILVAVLSYFLIMYLGFKVGTMRKKTGIKYPTMYSDKDNLFNCYQRAHQNTLENYPQFLMLLLLGGLYSPLAASLGGDVWLISRVVYAHGYYSGDPAKRNRGAFGYLGLLVLMYCSVRQATSMLGWC